MYIYICIDILIYIIYIYIYLYMCIYICIYIYVYIYMYICVYVYIYIWYICVCVYVYIGDTWNVLGANWKKFGILMYPNRSMFNQLNVIVGHVRKCWVRHFQRVDYTYTYHGLATFSSCQKKWDVWYVTAVWTRVGDPGHTSSHESKSSKGSKPLPLWHWHVDHIDVSTTKMLRCFQQWSVYGLCWSKFESKFNQLKLLSL